MGWLRRLRNTVLTSRSDADLAEEMRFHFDRRVEDYVMEGMPRRDAIRAAALRLGNRPLASDQARDADTIHWLADFGQDLGYGVRNILKNPGLSLIHI